MQPNQRRAVLSRILSALAGFGPSGPVIRSLFVIVNRATLDTLTVRRIVRLLSNEARARARMI